MTEADREALAEALHVLGEMFNERVSTIRAEGYFDALRDYAIEDVNRAVLMALRTCRFFPRPVELRELLCGDPNANTDAAWSTVVREVRRVGYLGTPCFDGARVMRAITDTWGSWQRLCETLPGEGPELLGWVKQFKSAFQSVDRRANQELVAGKLPSQIRAKVVKLVSRKSIQPEPVK